MSKLNKTAERSFEELSAKDVRHIWECSPEELEEVITHAQNQKPPNEAVLAIAGAAGAIRSEMLLSPGGGMPFAQLAEKALPGVDIHDLRLVPAHDVV